jgi:uncharacterized Zn-finger protein
MHEITQEHSDDGINDDKDYYNPDNPNREFQCTICYKVFKSRSTLTSHKKVHSDDVPYECHHCSLKIRYRSSLLKHMKQHMGDAKFKTMVQLNVDGKYLCQICQKQYSSKKNLRQHQKLHGERNYACDVCGSSFAEQSRLTQHQKIHTDQKEFSCDICNKSFRLKYTLDIHIKRHNSEWLYNCNFCEKGFVLRHDWMVHEDKHRNEQQFECTVCEKKCNSQKNLRTHMLIHSKEKTLECQWEGCTKLYRDQQSRRVHYDQHVAPKLERVLAVEAVKEVGSNKNKTNVKIKVKPPVVASARPQETLSPAKVTKPSNKKDIKKLFAEFQNLKSHIFGTQEKNTPSIDITSECGESTVAPPAPWW